MSGSLELNELYVGNEPEENQMHIDDGQDETRHSVTDEQPPTLPEREGIGDSVGVGTIRDVSESNNFEVERQEVDDVERRSSKSTKMKKRKCPRCLHVLIHNKMFSFLRKQGIIVIPPGGVLGRLLTRMLVVLVWIGVLWAVLGTYVYPGPAPIDLNALLNEGGCGSPIATGDPDYNGSNLTGQVGVIGNETNNTACIAGLAYNITAFLSRMSPKDIVDFYNNGTQCLDRDNPSCVVHDLLACLNLSSTSCSSDGMVAVSNNKDIFDIEQGHFFGLIALGIVAAIFGFAVSLIRLPPLVGMLIAGVLLNNVPYIAVTRLINPRWSSIIRSVALVIILIRGGISMDAGALKKLFFPVVALGAIPCIVEGGVVALLAFLLLQLRWQWALMTGYLLAAISPAVLVPSLLLLQNKKPPTADDKGLPTMMIVSGALDDVISIALFGVFLGLAFSSGTSLALTILRGPIEIILGLVFGIIVGVVLWYLPPYDAKPGSAVRNRFFLILGFSLFALFGAQQIKVGDTGFVGAGALAIIVLAFVVNLKWKKYQSSLKLKRSLLMAWLFVQPFLFGLIGAAVDVYSIDLQVLGQSFAVVLLGLVARVFAVFLVTLPLRLPWKYQIFCCICWIPKATVQAALAGIVTDIVLLSTSPRDACDGILVLTLAVLEIVIAAPLGATLIGIFGPSLLYSQPMCGGMCIKKNEEPQGTDLQIVSSDNGTVKGEDPGNQKLDSIE